MIKRSILILLMCWVSPALAENFPIADHKFACPDKQYSFTINQFMAIGLSDKALKTWFRGNDGLYYVEAGADSQTMRFGFHPRGSIAVMKRMAVTSILVGGSRVFDGLEMILMCNEFGAGITDKLNETSAGGGVKSDDYEP